MRVSQISVNYQNFNSVPRVKTGKQPTFRGKHDTAKVLCGVFGALGTLGAIGGTIIMTGGVALPFVLGYGAACGGSGAIIGHMIDKSSPDYNKKK